MYMVSSSLLKAIPKDRNFHMILGYHKGISLVVLVFIWLFHRHRSYFHLWTSLTKYVEWKICYIWKVDLKELDPMFPNKWLLDFKSYFLSSQLAYQQNLNFFGTILSFYDTENNSKTTTNWKARNEFYYFTALGKSSRFSLPPSSNFFEILLSSGNL